MVPEFNRPVATNLAQTCGMRKPITVLSKSHTSDRIHLMFVLSTYMKHENTIPWRTVCTFGHSGSTERVDVSIMQEWAQHWSAEDHGDERKTAIQVDSTAIN
jgi:hypothetical protein